MIVKLAHTRLADVLDQLYRVTQICLTFQENFNHLSYSTYLHEQTTELRHLAGNLWK